MTGQDPGNPADRAALAREDEINALLDGALDEVAVEALKAAAAEDSDLAQAIVAAWQLQQSMDQLHLEKAPPSLRRKLRRIPHQHKAASRRRLLPLPRWVLACGLASVVLIAVAMMMSPPPGPAVRPSQQAASGSGIDPAQVAQTRRDLATAFRYLDKIGMRVGREIHEELNEELSAPIKDNFSKYMPYSGQSLKEKNA